MEIDGSKFDLDSVEGSESRNAVTWSYHERPSDTDGMSPVFLPASRSPGYWRQVRGTDGEDRRAGGSDCHSFSLKSFMVLDLDDIEFTGNVYGSFERSRHLRSRRCTGPYHSTECRSHCPRRLAQAAYVGSDVVCCFSLTFAAAACRLGQQVDMVPATRASIGFRWRIGVWLMNRSTPGRPFQRRTDCRAAGDSFTPFCSRAGLWAFRGAATTNHV
jgi:hypothetical protein